MKDKKGNLHCGRCGAFVEPDNESNALRWHYSCNNCMSSGYITIKSLICKRCYYKSAEESSMVDGYCYQCAVDKGLVENILDSRY